MTCQRGSLNQARIYTLVVGPKGRKRQVAVRLSVPSKDLQWYLTRVDRISGTRMSTVMVGGWRDARLSPMVNGQVGRSVSLSICPKIPSRILRIWRKYTRGGCNTAARVFHRAGTMSSDISTTPVPFRGGYRGERDETRALWVVGHAMVFSPRRTTVFLLQFQFRREKHQHHLARARVQGKADSQLGSLEMFSQSCLIYCVGYCPVSAAQIQSLSCKDRQGHESDSQARAVLRSLYPVGLSGTVSPLLL